MCHANEAPGLVLTESVYLRARQAAWHGDAPVWCRVSPELTGQKGPNWRFAARPAQGRMSGLDTLPGAFMRTKTLLVSLSAALALMACGKNEPAAPAAGAASSEQGPLVLKLGHSAPLTGPQAHIGKDTEYGAQMAVEDANAANIQLNGRTLKVELLGED